MTILQIAWLTIILAALMLAGAYAAWYQNAHADLLAECKGPERGIHLSVGNKSYFYYCSYVRPRGHMIRMTAYGTTYECTTAKEAVRLLMFLGYMVKPPAVKPWQVPRWSHYWDLRACLLGLKSFMEGA